VIAAAPDRSLHRLTIDAALQRNLEDLARERARALGSEISVAIVAVDHGSGEVLARVASADYFDTRRSGQVDMTAAVRSPGSTLKPFIYGLGFEDGLIHPDTLIEDRPIRFGSYAPENFDLTFQGTVTVRRALQLSLNVPAVAVLDKIGANRFAARLEQAGGSFALPEGEVPGLAIGLGGVGVKLTDLVALYAGLARLGTTVPLTERVANSVEATPGPWASTAGIPSGYGSAAPTARRYRACSGGSRRRRSCSMPLRAPASCRPRCRGRPAARSLRRRPSCRRPCSVSAPALSRARVPSPSSASCFRPTAPDSSLRAMAPASLIRSRSR
jgi:hypothetical protein